jgi:transcriptional regulator with XRE-family HTH domain
MLRLRVKEVAEAKGYNMSSLSRASDVSFRTIKRMWRNPHHEANTTTLHKIARALGVPTAELIEDVPDKESPNE